MEGPGVTMSGSGGSSSSGGRWDRRELRRLSFKQRMEIERRLTAGQTGMKIAKEMKLRGSVQVSAVKKNPWPGGVRDPKGALANFEGNWMDEQGVERPYVGLKNGKVIYKDPVSRSGKMRALSLKADGKVVAAETVLKFPPRAPAGVETSVQPPDAKTAEEAPEDLGEAIPSSAGADIGAGGGNAGTVGSGDGTGKLRTSPEQSLERVRRLGRRALPLKERIDILAGLARLGAKEPQVAMKAITTLNQLDGITTAASSAGAGGIGSGPLFQLPRDMGMGFAPIGVQDEREPSATEDATMSDEVSAEVDAGALTSLPEDETADGGATTDDPADQRSETDERGK